MEYYCAARKCNTDFIKGIQRDPNGNCRYSIKVVSESFSQVRFFRYLVHWLSQIRSFPTLTHCTQGRPFLILSELFAVKLLLYRSL